MEMNNENQKNFLKAMKIFIFALNWYCFLKPFLLSSGQDSADSTDSTGFWIPDLINVHLQLPLVHNHRRFLEYTG